MAGTPPVIVKCRRIQMSPGVAVQLVRLTAPPKAMLPNPARPDDQPESLKVVWYQLLGGVVMVYCQE